MDLEVWIQKCRSDANLTLIEDFIRKGISLSYATQHGTTALHVACACGQERTVDLLLRHRAPIDAVDKLGWTPVMQAARNGHSTIVNKLLAVGANEQLETCYGANLLFLASASNDVKTINAVKNGISRVNLFKQTKSTRMFPLAIAIVFDNLTTVNELLKINSDVNISSSIGLTPLMIACAVGRPNIANFFFDNKANIDASNCLNHTALDMALLTQNNHIIRLLNGKLAENEQLRSNRTHLTSHLSPHLLYHSPMGGRYPNISLWPSPTPQQSKHESPRGWKTKSSPTADDGFRSLSYLDHILSSARKSPTYCKSPETRISNDTGAAVFPRVSPHTKYNFPDRSSLKGVGSPAFIHGADSPSYNPRDKFENRPGLYGTELESEYGRSVDQEKLQTSGLYFRQGTPSIGKHVTKLSNLNKLRETNEGSKEAVTPCKKQSDSKLKSRWSGLHRTLSKLKSPKPKRSFSPQARQAAVSQHPASSSHLKLLLEEMGLTQFAPLFIEQELDVETFLKLTEDDLKEIGIGAQNCNRILLALNTLKGN